MWRVHRKLFIRTLATMSLLLLLLCGVDAVTADDEEREHVTRFTAIDISCEVLDPGMVTVDAEGVTHIEGQVFKGIVTSDNELIAGTSYIIVDAVIEPGSDITQLWVNVSYYPTAVRGTWVAPGQGQVSPEGLLVRHRGQGTRDLRKSRIKFEVRGATDVGTLPCTPVIPPAELKGVIIDKR